MRHGRILAAIRTNGFMTIAACMLAACGVWARAGTVTIEWDNGARQVVGFDERAGRATPPTTAPTTQPSSDGTAAVKTSAATDGTPLNETRPTNEPPGTPVAARGWLGSNRTVVVPSGTYLVNFNLAGLHDLTISWDGKGTKPILKASGGGSNMFSFDATSRNITFDGFSIDAGNRNAFHLAGKNLTFRNLEFTSCADAFLAEQSVDGVTIDQCRVIGDTAMTSYFLWAGGGDASIENVTVSRCAVPNSTRQHIVRLRFGKIRKITFDGCDFANIDRRQEGDRQDIANHTFFIQQGSDITVRNCTLRDGSLAIGPLGGDDGANDKDAADAAVSNVRIEGCKFVSTHVEINAGTSDVLVKNNEFRLDFPDPNAGVGAFVSIQGEDKSHGWRREVSGIVIDGNTGITNTIMARFLSIHGPLAEGVTLRGNTFIAPKMICGGHGASIISAPSPAAIKESSNNTWPDAKADGWANKGIFNLGPDGTGTGHGFWSKTMWLKLPGVRGDRFE